MRALTAADFRPRFFNDDDPLFLGLFGVFNLIAVLFYVAILILPPVEDNALDHVDDAADLIVDRLELPKPVVEIAPEPGADEPVPDKPKEAPKAQDAPPPPRLRRARTRWQRSRWCSRRSVRMVWAPTSSSTTFSATNRPSPGRSRARSMA